MGNIVLFGLPGAGKGTQADNLKNDFNLFKVSTGDLLREEIKKESPLGKKIKSTIDQGHLVDDLTINNLVENILCNENYYNRLIFDGYPRNLQQAKNFDILIKKNNQAISCVLNLNVQQDVIIKRILGRRVCSKCGLIFNNYFSTAKNEKHQCDAKYLHKRSDDNEETLKNRFEIYNNETLPILDYYKNQNLLYEIDGMGDIHTIYKEIRHIILSLEA